MHVSFFYTKEFAGFLFGNAGLGPARLHWFTVSVDNRLQPNWLSMFQALGFEKPPKFEFSVPSSGGWYRSDTLNEILKVPPGPDYQKLTAEVGRIGIGGCYCSLYEECWLFNRSTEKYRVSSCQDRPKLVFSAPPAPK
jgi:hypothetical protein